MSATATTTTTVVGPTPKIGTVQAVEIVNYLDEIADFVEEARTDCEEDISSFSCILDLTAQSSIAAFNAETLRGYLDSEIGKADLPFRLLKTWDPLDQVASKKATLETCKAQRRSCLEEGSALVVALDDLTAQRSAWYAFA